MSEAADTAPPSRGQMECSFFTLVVQYVELFSVVILENNTLHKTKLKQSCSVFLHGRVSRNIRVLKEEWKLRCALAILHDMPTVCVMMP